MKRSPRIQDLSTSVVVIGSGVAGLTCALALAPAPVILLTKTPRIAGGSSVWAKGGIAAAIGAEDSADQHAADTVAAGGGIADSRMASVLAEGGLDAISTLIQAGVAFDRQPNGDIALGREAAHGRDRIVHAGGDATGQSLIAALVEQVEAAPSIRVLTNTVAVDLISAADTVSGVVAFGRDEGWFRIYASDVVLATGGVGALWQETTNPRENTGDGLALAARGGADLADLEFMQFHPTALDVGDRSGNEQLPLLTEALRGAGAMLVDGNGHAFMEDEHPMADLAPRDVVARAIARRSSAGERMYLDLRPALTARGINAFPQAVQVCRDAGLDPCASPVPIAPAAHYHMGGVVTDAAGRTSVKGLWACGEVASTGVHGANRLASNSLLEGVVFGRRVADAIWNATSNGRLRPPSVSVSLRLAPASEASALRETARGLMSRHVGLLRDADGLSRAIAGIAELDNARRDITERWQNNASELGFDDVRASVELRNTMLAARLVATAAFRRKESRGAHRRADYPTPDPAWAAHQYITSRELEVETGHALYRVMEHAT